MSLRSDLGRVRGLGSAKDGSDHWQLQRLTAIALLPLTLWFVWTLLCKLDSSHAEVSAWIAQPVVTVLLVSMVLAMFWHIKLGLQVVIEDYVHAKGLLFTAQVALRLGTAIGAVAATLAILRIAFGNA